MRIHHLARQLAGIAVAAAVAARSLLVVASPAHAVPTVGRRWRRLYAVLFAGVVVAATLVSPQAGSAYTLATRPNCASISWESPPQYVVHLPEFFDGGGDYDDLAALYQAIYDVSVQLNGVGGSSAEVLFTGNQAHPAPFDYGTWYNDAAPTLHIGFTSGFADEGAAAEVKRGPVDEHCKYTEAHMAIVDLDHRNWNFGTPQDSGQDFYYTAEASDAAGAIWFRPVFLHELLHAFGLSHSDDTYAFMNYEDFPWANRADDEAIRPLPDDVRALRRLYRGGGDRSEVAVLNTWYTAGVSDSGAAIAYRNCAPSLGDTDSTTSYALLCGAGGPDGGETEVCPGDVLRTRYSLANYSTREVNLVAWLYFSRDDVYNFGLDTLSDTVHSGTVIPAGHSTHKSPAWVVPNVTTFDADYHVIVRVTGTTGGVPVEDWIPLTGTVHVPSQFECL